MITLNPGERVGTYTVHEFIARGAFACVYLAEDSRGVRVALKIGDVAGGGRYVTRFPEITNERNPGGISPDETPAEAVFFRKEGAKLDFLDALEIDIMMRAESRLLQAARHPNVVGLHDVFTHQGRVILALDYIQGNTLREKIRAYNGIRLNWFLTIVRALRTLRRSRALAYHGDLKPENIILNSAGSVILIDPAMRVNKGSEISTTPHYNPFLLRDSKADVMGIGIMLYEILTGVLPFHEVPWRYAGRELGGDVENLSLSYFVSYPPPKDLNPSIPDEMPPIISRCIRVPDYGLGDLERDLVEFLRLPETASGTDEPTDPSLVAAHRRPATRQRPKSRSRMTRRSLPTEHGLPDLALDGLASRHPGLTPALGTAYAEAARVCLDRHHASPIQCQIHDPASHVEATVSWQPTSRRERRAWRNDTDATACGAYAFALAATELTQGLVAVCRASTLTGADYYLAPKGSDIEDIESCVRLEVSGIDRDRPSRVKERIRKKKDQCARGKSDLPAMVGVVCFQRAMIVTESL